MTTLYVPLHLPILQSRTMLERELRYREILSAQVTRHSLIIEHERMSHESASEILSCIEGPIIVT